ncbi:nucleotidyltransferase domain-containing protein [Coleofasciculus sp. FACHB-T130]|uniref:nucleotidyltransferase domain-containing protein n=1 Tax=Cyanophyceae TaxID=3028117 RepID=UPI001681DFC2|nr:nucleotidyltransferase domain-containing protein [Coleofasciculus sp. FACHB-T130]MBD1880548.1 nucleotidyltransferase domain-containing protein [Coleofasciculus sp. FACHB-T130]
MSRKSIATNIARKLWAQCGGFCQNPSCIKYLFAGVEDDVVSLANVAHIIGHGKSGPRSEHELADYIDKDGIANLIMLCLECHKIVDELENKFSVERMQAWKADHEKKINSLFDFPQIRNERELLEEVNELLTENRVIFEEYGPFSQQALQGSSGDALTIWRRRCLDTILPNNQRIVGLIEANKRNFPYPWEVYRQMMGYKLHSDSFRDNCLLEKKVNDYKLFPKEFDDFIKQSLGLPVENRENRSEEEIEFRKATVSKYIEDFLATHSFITRMEKLNIAMFDVELKDGRSLRVFATNTYFFTEYTFEQVMAIDPAVDAIICSNPYGAYTREAKALCIDHKIGLFTLKTFMGAIRKDGDEFLNYLPNDERSSRLSFSKSLLSTASVPPRFQVYIFGSYLRRELYNDIDLIVVYTVGADQELISSTLESISQVFEKQASQLDITVCSEEEYAAMSFEDDNRNRIR